MSGPLSDLRVIEYCGALGQYAGKLLADMGADLIKVEPPGGSEARAAGPFAGDVPGPNHSLSFWYDNTNKRSVVLDIENDPADRERFRTLAAGADVLLEAMPPGFLAALGLGYEELAAANPGLVMCSLTPYGQDGPWADYRTSDMVALATGGPMGMNGYDPEDVPGAPPIHGKGEQGYRVAGHFAAIGTLVALYERDVSGRGQHVDCSMHEALSSTTEVGLPYWLYTRQNIIRQTGRHASVQRTERWQHPTKDGRYILVYGVGRSAASWTKMRAWMGEHGFGQAFDDPRFDDPRARQPGRGTPEAAEIFKELARFIAALDAEEVYRRAQECGLPWGVVRSPEENLDESHFRDRGLVVSVTGEGAEGPVEMPGAPYIFSATPWELRRPAPKLGEHTAEVLAEIEAATGS